MEEAAGELSNSCTESGGQNDLAISGTNGANDNSSEPRIPNGECTPQHASEHRPIDNSIFNTISKIVNPTTKVRTGNCLHSPLCVVVKCFYNLLAGFLYSLLSLQRSAAFR